ncbi:probable chitinase 10 [Teleopsis dalmanni]|uniref:probable chitinase 10 n=1 Tax=Teleopsis dalmanni TaxID=139649 RepID=UPI0018CF3EBC|nr:probable chitinase 10 [Teleopsis dalmanni]
MTNKFNIIYVLIFLTLRVLNTVNAETFAECDGVDEETFVASSSSCNAYIYCLGEESMMGECAEDEYFDAESQGCDDANVVPCFLDEEGDEEEEDEEGEEEDEEEEEPITTTTAATTTTTTPANPIETTFDPLSIPPVILDTCPNVDDPSQIVLMASSQSCSDYYMCYHGHAIEMHCTNHLHFNANTGKCDFPEYVQCAINRPNANKCLPHVTDFFPHPEKCNYFYYCIKGFLTVQQCPFYYGWDIERRSCVQLSQAKCYNNAK